MLIMDNDYYTSQSIEKIKAYRWVSNNIRSCLSIEHIITSRKLLKNYNAMYGISRSLHKFLDIKNFQIINNNQTKTLNYVQS